MGDLRLIAVRVRTASFRFQAQYGLRRNFDLRVWRHIVPASCRVSMIPTVCGGDRLTFSHRRLSPKFKGKGKVHMHRPIFALTTFVVFAGCQEPLPRVPMVSADTQTDLQHAHKHQHGDQHRHDHRHEDDFKGSHTHPHVHGHRHGPSPHGGQIVTLMLLPGGEVGSDTPRNGHLEIVEELPNRLLFYLLEEHEEDFFAWDVAVDNAVVSFGLNNQTHDLKMNAGKQPGLFSVDLPPGLFVAKTDSEAFEFEIPSLLVGNHTFHVPENLVFRADELDVVVENSE